LEWVFFIYDQNALIEFIKFQHIREAKKKTNNNNNNNKIKIRENYCLPPVTFKTSQTAPATF